MTEVSEYLFKANHHASCGMQRGWRKPEDIHWDCCATADDREAWACECPCHGGGEDSLTGES